jgi:hypothetical protein
MRRWCDHYLTIIRSEQECLLSADFLSMRRTARSSYGMDEPVVTLGGGTEVAVSMAVRRWAKAFPLPAHVAKSKRISSTSTNRMAVRRWVKSFPLPSHVAKSKRIVYLYEAYDRGANVQNHNIRSALRYL